MIACDKMSLPVLNRGALDGTYKQRKMDFIK